MGIFIIIIFCSLQNPVREAKYKWKDVTIHQENAHGITTFLFSILNLEIENLVK